MTRRLCAVLLALLLFAAVLPVRAGVDPAGAAYDRAAAWVLAAAPAPTLGPVGGEWAALGLVRGGAALPDGYLRGYLLAVEQTVAERKGVLHQKKYSEYSRVILALTAIGADPTRAAGYDLTAPLSDVESTLRQGLNGAVWALIALDCGPYGTPELRDRYAQELLSCQLADGGWALMGERADPDMTAMALQALAPHRALTGAETAVRSGLDRLAALQTDGDYGTAESTAQTLVALCRLGLHEDGRFSGLVSALLAYARPDGGFAHTTDRADSDPMSTEQALYALAALRRARDGQADLYDMSDVSLPHPAVTPRPVVLPDRSFSDLDDRPWREDVEELGRRAVLAGRGDGRFWPEDGLSRAEFAALVVQALGLAPQRTASRFTDVKDGAWYASFITEACDRGIVSGVGGGRFDPEGAVTREQAAVMVRKAAALCALPAPADADGSSAPDRVSPWAREAVSFCAASGLWLWPEDDPDPGAAVTRGEMAGMLRRLMASAGLLT